MNPMMAERSVSQKADSLTEGASELLLSSFSSLFFFLLLCTSLCQ